MALVLFVSCKPPTLGRNAMHTTHMTIGSLVNLRNNIDMLLNDREVTQRASEKVLSEIAARWQVKPKNIPERQDSEDLIDLS